MKVAYYADGELVFHVFLTEIPIDIENYVVVNDDSLHPSYCYIEDGQIKIDQQKFIEFNRKKMPTLSPIDFDIKLNNAGLYDAVQDLIKDNFELRIAYTRAIFFSRVDPFIDQARIALGLTDEQVDELWTAP